MSSYTLFIKKRPIDASSASENSTALTGCSYASSGSSTDVVPLLQSRFLVCAKMFAKGSYIITRRTGKSSPLRHRGSTYVLSSEMVSASRPPLKTETQKPTGKLARFSSCPPTTVLFRKIFPRALLGGVSMVWQLNVFSGTFTDDPSMLRRDGSSAKMPAPDSVAVFCVMTVPLK